MTSLLCVIITGYSFFLPVSRSEIENSLVRHLHAQKVGNFWIVKGNINKNIEEYIIPEYPDKVHKKIWKDLKFQSKIEIKDFKRGSEIIIQSDIKVLGWPDKVFIPPFYEKRKSNGKLEKEIFEAIKNKKFYKTKIHFRNNYELDPPFEQNIDLVTTPPADEVTQNELSCEIKGAKIVAGWNDRRGTGGGAGYTVGMSYSTDSGVTWSQNQFPANGLWYPEQGDPVLTWGKGDTVYFAFISFDRNAWQGDIGLLISPDGGVTWTDSVNITNDLNFDDKPWINAYGDTVLLSYAGGSGFYIYFRKSVDGGLTFSSPVYINSGGNGSMPKMGPNGEIYVMWGLDSPQNWQYDEGIWIRKSTDGGNSFGSTVHVADLYDSQSLLPWRCYAIPSMDVDMNTGYVYITYQSTDAGHTHWDAYIARSIDGGNSFEAPVRINDVITGHQFFPWVSVDEYSRVHVIWYDTRAGGYNLDIYYAYSDDYGQTFSPNMRVTDVTKPPVGQTFIGDYIAVDARNGIVGAAWCHPKQDNSSDDAWFARMTYTSVSEKPFTRTEINFSTIDPDFKKILKLKGAKVLDTRGRTIKSYRSLKNGIYFINLNGYKIKILRLKHKF